MLRRGSKAQQLTSQQAGRRGGREGEEGGEGEEESPMYWMVPPTFRVGLPSLPC
jgi:hypothetical protein